MNKNYKTSLMLMFALALGTAGTVSAKNDEYVKAYKTNSSFDKKELIDTLKSIKPGQLTPVTINAANYVRSVQSIEDMGFVLSSDVEQNTNVLYKDAALITKINNRSISSELESATTATGALVKEIRKIIASSSKSDEANKFAALNALLNLNQDGADFSQATKVGDITKALDAFGNEDKGVLATALTALDSLKSKVTNAQNGLYITDNEAGSLRSGFNALAELSTKIESMQSTFFVKATGDAANSKAGDTAVTVHVQDILSKILNSVGTAQLQPIAEAIQIGIKNDISVTAEEQVEMSRMLPTLKKAVAVTKLVHSTTVNGDSAARTAGLTKLMNAKTITDVINFAKRGAAAGGGGGAAAFAEAGANTHIETALPDFGTLLGKLAGIKVGLSAVEIAERANELLRIGKTNQHTRVQDQALVDSTGTESIILKNLDQITEEEQIVLSNLVSIMEIDVTGKGKPKTYKSGSVFTPSANKQTAGFMKILENNKASLQSTSNMQVGLQNIKTDVVNAIAKNIKDVSFLSADAATGYSTTITVVEHLLASAKSTAQGSLDASKKESLVRDIDQLTKQIDKIKSNEVYKTATAHLQTSETEDDAERLTAQEKLEREAQEKLERERIEQEIQSSSSSNSQDEEDEGDDGKKSKPPVLRGVKGFTRDFKPRLKATVDGRGHKIGSGVKMGSANVKSSESKNQAQPSQPKK